MPTAHGNGIEIEYETSGNPADPRSFWSWDCGAQLIAWPEAFVQQLAGRGFFIIRYDNRDSGLSTKFEGTPDFATLSVVTCVRFPTGSKTWQTTPSRCSTTSAWPAPTSWGHPWAA